MTKFVTATISLKTAPGDADTWVMNATNIEKENATMSTPTRVGPFTLLPVSGSHVVEVKRTTSGFFVGLFRVVPEGFRAKTWKGWETFSSIEAAVAAVAS